MNRLVAVVTLAACGGGASKAIDAPTGGDGVVLPPLDAAIDYQLGGAYPPPAGVKIVSRDRTASPAPGLYNICYVNGFQIQPGEASDWMTSHADLILRDSGGQPIIDTEWNEMLIDVSSAAKRTRVAAIVSGWIDGCKAKGYDAIEIDNLDSFSRSRGTLTEANNVAAMAMFSAAAHQKGMAIAQKNSAEIVSKKAELGTDFVVAEECNTFDECQTYRDAYGDHVLVIEYVRADFDKGCTRFPTLSIVLRDRDLVPEGASGYVFEGC